MTLRRGDAARLLALVVLVVLIVFVESHGVRAFIPKGDRIAEAAAEANKAGERAQALQLELTLRVAEREPIGTGVLVTHPTGLARLELRDAGQRVERHLLVGTEHTASRNGEPLASPRPFLPPLFLLQVDSPMTFRRALTDYRLDPDAVSLAPCGTRVCYVIGDPARVAPPPPEEEEQGEGLDPGEEARGEPFETAVDDEDVLADGEDLETGSEPPRATLWIDTESFEIRRMLFSDGVAVDFGEFVDWDGVRFPDSITISEPLREPVRFDILAVTPVNAPAAEFRRAWLIPPEGDPPRSEPGPE